MTILDDRYARLERVQQEKVSALCRRKIFFGHRSVGLNIIEGLRDVMRATPLVRLDIRETASPQDFEEPIFAHALIGTNKNASSKIKAFRNVLEAGIGQLADIAFFKLCFVDIDRSSDLRALFKEHDETISSLTKKYPKLKIITVTVPLVSGPVGLKARVAKLLGRTPWPKQDNIKRNEYNGMLRAKYGESLFDLAKTESTMLGGEKTVSARNGGGCEVLVRAYTGDGGHLNALGRQLAAIDLLLHLMSYGLD